MIVLVVVGFVFHAQLHLASSTVALTAAAVMLLIGRRDVEEIVAGVEWATILFFLGLFVVVGGLQETGVIQLLANGLMDLTHGNRLMMMLMILWGSAILSAFLDNIPFVATLIPLILTMEQGGMDVTPLWWAVSLGACLGGTAPSSAPRPTWCCRGDQRAQRIPHFLWALFQGGLPLMLLSMVICTVFLLVRFG